MRKAVLNLACLMLLVAPLPAQTADDIIAKYVKTVGGMDKIAAVKTLRRTGKYTGGGGFEAVVIQENKRPTSVREEFLIQGMTGVNAYDGHTGWKIEPWNGKKDAEPLSEEEMRTIVEDADFDEALVNYRQKGNKIEYVGMDQVEGTDVYKLKMTLASGDVRYYFMDTDYYVPIKIESQRTIRGALQESETSFGDYKEVAGWYLPHSFEMGRKGSQDKAKIVFDKIEANVVLDDSRFVKPSLGQTTQQAAEGPDASKNPAAKADPAKPAAPAPASPAKPPVTGGR